MSSEVHKCTDRSKATERKLTQTADVTAIFEGLGIDITSFNSDECEWNGNSCDCDNFVTHIELEKGRGSIATEVGNLEKLLQLSICKSDFL